MRSTVLKKRHRYRRKPKFLILKSFCTHCGGKAHLVCAATMDTIKVVCLWSGSKEDLRYISQASIHYIPSKSKKQVSHRQFSADSRATENQPELSMQTFLHKAMKESVINCILIIKDKVCSYAWLHPRAGANGEDASYAFSRQVSYLRVLSWLVVDRWCYSEPKLIKFIVSRTRTQKHFTTAGRPLATFTLERIYWDALRISRAQLSDWCHSVSQ